MAQAEQPERQGRTYEVSVDDVRQLMGASTPHFALQLRNRIHTLIEGLPEDHPARREGELEIQRLDQIALGSERRGPIQPHEEGLPSFRAPAQPADYDTAGLALRSRLERRKRSPAQALPQPTGRAR